MYLEYYSLERRPFRITPDPCLFYTGGANGRGVVLEALLYAVTSGEGILKVVGEVGSGKTMLCRMLEQRLPDSVEVVYLANPNLTPHEILYAIAFELKLPVDHSTQRLVLMQHLQEYLLKQHADNRTVLVIIEEAQSMPIATLEEVRLFSNLETHQHKLMQIVLFGQPELDKNLQDKSIRQLRERITHSFDLRPLGADEVGDYIRFRLQAAGCPAPQVFSSAAEKLISKASAGLTRRINILADKAMLAAYAESATEQRPRTIDNLLQPTVHAKHVRAAIKDSGYKQAFWTWSKLLVSSVIVLIAVLSLAWWQLNASVEMSTLPMTQFKTETQPQPQAVASQSVEVAVQVPAEQLTAAVVAEPSVVNEPALDADIPTSSPVNVLDSANANDAVNSVAANSVANQNVEEADSASSSTLLQPLQEVGTLSPLLRARSIAMQDRLVESNPEAYTVQLLSLSSTESAYVARVLNRLDQAGIIDKTYTCISNSQGQDYWKVVYGDFASANEARTSIEGLPVSLRNNRPYVQTIDRLNCNVAMSLSELSQEATQ